MSADQHDHQLCRGLSPPYPRRHDPALTRPRFAADLWVAFIMDSLRLRLIPVQAHAGLWRRAPLPKCRGASAAAGNCPAIASRRSISRLHAWYIAHGPAGCAVTGTRRGRERYGCVSALILDAGALVAVDHDDRVAGLGGVVLGCAGRDDPVPEFVRDVSGGLLSR